MNPIEYWLESIEHKKTVTSTNKDGKEDKKIITVIESILHMKVISKSYLDMIDQYGLSVQQAKMLNELMKDDYWQLYLKLIY